MIETENTGRAHETQSLRGAANLLCLWRVCANQSCRRARSCRGRAALCAKRNGAILPEGVRAFFVSFLAAKWAGVAFEDFKQEMGGREETEAFFDWRKQANARPR
jgi:hypothetical protein